MSQWRLFPLEHLMVTLLWQWDHGGFLDGDKRWGVVLGKLASVYHWFEGWRNVCWLFEPAAEGQGGTLPQEGYECLIYLCSCILVCHCDWSSVFPRWPAWLWVFYNPLSEVLGKFTWACLKGGIVRTDAAEAKGLRLRDTTSAMAWMAAAGEQV